MPTTNVKFNERPVSCLNMLVTDSEKFDTLVQQTLTEPVNGCYVIFIDPKGFYYNGLEYSCQDAIFHEWNKYLLSLNITPEQMKQLDSIKNTMCKRSHDAGWRSAELHVRSMVVSDRYISTPYGKFEVNTSTKMA